MKPDYTYILTNPKHFTTERYVKRHWPELHGKVVNLPGNKFSEKLYNYYHPDSHKCLHCGKPTQFLDFSRGYQPYCSRTCAGIHTADTAYETSKRNHGGKHHTQCNDVRRKMSITNIQRYGGTGFASESVRAKYKQTCIARYGNECAVSSDIVKQRIKNRCQELFGSPTFAQQHILEDPNITIVENCYRIKCGRSCCEHGYFDIPFQLYQWRKQDGTELCTRLLPQGHQLQDTTIELFVKNILDECGVEYEHPNKTLIHPKHVDFYIPSKRIAIECNGIYWHSDKCKINTKIHQEKFTKCQQQGVQLLTLWEDQIVNHPEIVKSIILNKLGYTTKTIYARSTKISSVESKDFERFLNTNHIQGSCKCTIRYGLYSGDELVAVMGFNRRSKLSGSKNTNSTEWELSRFTSLINTHIPGAASRLLKHFCQEYVPDIITSFSSNDISDGNLYKQLGFKEGKCNQSYWYIEYINKQYKRYHRSTFCKDNIIKRGWAPTPDKSKWTEKEVMDKLGFFRIYDSGTTTWTLKL